MRTRHSSRQNSDEGDRDSLKIRTLTLHWHGLTVEKTPLYTVAVKASRHMPHVIRHVGVKLRLSH